eukprot:m.1332529 g.1332529  ORF g.1332529 m.1332529 type:complete len:385 (-) comp24869_c0_seq11:5937-7091(-)
MKVDGKHYRTIWIEENGEVTVIDQHKLPHIFETITAKTAQDMAVIIKDMHIRGAGLVGASAGAGMHLAARSFPADGSVADFNTAMETAAALIKATRPTAANCEWAVRRQLACVAALPATATVHKRQEAMRFEAQAIMDEDSEWCRRIGEHGLSMIKDLAAKKKSVDEPVNILTHCNAGWLAFVDYGSATAPIYAAHDAGIPVHVYVGETRPRNQGAALTAWELQKHGVPHTVIVDNLGGHLMQHGMVDMVIVGADRVLRNGDVCNKIGTYLKALAAHDNKVPMVVALPSSTFDWTMTDGVKQVPIEKRDASEVKYIQGLYKTDGDGTADKGQLAKVLLCPPESPALNYAFDVTPARLVDHLITERGVCEANEDAVLTLYPEHSA